MDKTHLGDRMKGYEMAEAGRRTLPLLPICIRIDGRNFSKWTKGLARPYDERLSTLFIETTKYLLRETHATVGYTQSDEISLVLHSNSYENSTFFDRRLQKLSSVVASLATAAFNQRIPALIPERRDTPATFDCRVWSVPNRDEAINTLLWREIDATKNSLAMATREYYPHSVVMNKSQAEMHDLLHQVGVNWNDYPAFFKRGTFIQRRKEIHRIDPATLDSLPPKHAARETGDLTYERWSIQAIDMPPFRKVTNRVAAIFEGTEPKTGQ